MSGCKGEQKLGTIVVFAKWQLDENLVVFHDHGMIMVGSGDLKNFEV